VVPTVIATSLRSETGHIFILKGEQTMNADDVFGKKDFLGEGHEAISKTLVDDGEKVKKATPKEEKKPKEKKETAQDASIPVIRKDLSMLIDSYIQTLAREVAKDRHPKIIPFFNKQTGVYFITMKSDGMCQENLELNKDEGTWLIQWARAIGVEIFK
jgi:hypothetical protein